MTATITIHDDATRRVLESVCWSGVRRILDPMDGTPLGSTIADMEQAVEGYENDPQLDYEDLLSELDSAIEGLVALRARIADVRAASVGDQIDIPMSAELFHRAVEYVKDGIEEYGPDFCDGGLLAQTQEVRKRLIGSRDAAARILEELGPVEAVA